MGLAAACFVAAAPPDLALAGVFLTTFLVLVTGAEPLVADFAGVVAVVAAVVAVVVEVVLGACSLVVSVFVAGSSLLAGVGAGFVDLAVAGLAGFLTVFVCAVDFVAFATFLTTEKIEK